MSHRSSQILNNHFREHKTDHDIFKFLKKAYGATNFKLIPTEWTGEDNKKLVMYTSWVDSHVRKWLANDTTRLEEYFSEGIESCMDCPYVVVSEDISESLELMLEAYMESSQVTAY